MAFIFHHTYTHTHTHAPLAFLLFNKIHKNYTPILENCLLICSLQLHFCWLSISKKRKKSSDLSQKLSGHLITDAWLKVSKSLKLTRNVSHFCITQLYEGLQSNKYPIFPIFNSTRLYFKILKSNNFHNIQAGQLSWEHVILVRRRSGLKSRQGREFIK